MPRRRSDGPDGPDNRPGPRSLGPYRIEQELGRGSMGTVYLGHDRRSGRPVALKTLRLGPRPGPEGGPLAGRGDARARFLREAGAAARLRHPGIVAVLDCGVVRDIGFIAMEYVAGDDLTAHTAPGRLLPVPVVLEFACQAARALAHAHRQGVVHRDVKPANLLVDAASGVVKVADFGIARMVDTGAWRTRTGQVLGSPAFMSPEQMAGRPVDGRTDLYALGVVLFLLLTGALPHPAASMGELMRAIAQEAAPDVRNLRPDLPEAVAHIVALALQKRPQLRYADGEQMADDLAAVLARGYR